MDEIKDTPQEEDALAPGLEEFMAEAPNPKELRAKTEEDMKEGVQEALDLRERIGKIVSGRSIYPQSGMTEKAGVDSMKSRVDEYMDIENKNIEEITNSALKFMGVREEKEG